MFGKILILMALLLQGTGSIQAATYYLDPVSGDMQGDGSASAPWGRLEDVVAANMIASWRYAPLPYNPSTSTLVMRNAGAPIDAGDTLMLLSGLHGTLFLQNYYNERPITILAAPDAMPVLRRVLIQAGRNWRLVGIHVSSEPYGSYDGGNLVFIESHGWQGPASRIDIERCRVYSAEQPWTTAQDWLDNVSNGIYVKGDSVRVTGSTVTNIDMGIQVVGDQCRVLRSAVVNFSGDGMRVLGSGILIEGNIIKNCYDVDDNHDDGIQSFTTNGFVVDRDTIRGNTIINNDDPNQPLAGPLQGIGCFDGFYNDWVVENNLIVVNHWHGITFMGARNCRIVNNTVLDPSPQQTPGASWIQIGGTKGGEPSTGCVVKNNVTNQLIVDGVSSHNVILKTLAEYAQNFVDPAAFDFHLREGSICIDSAEGMSAPAADHDGVVRPRGSRPDVGCYEFAATTAVDQIPAVRPILLYPNPTCSSIQLADLRDRQRTYTLRNLLGEVLQTGAVHGPTARLDLSRLPQGIYLLILDRRVYRIIKM